MQNLKEILTAHGRRYPQMRPRDAVGLLYQNEFGPAHGADDENAALSLLKEDYAAAQGGSATVAEDIGGGFCRLNLAPAKGAGFSCGLVGRLFFASAKAKSGASSNFEDKLEQLAAITAAGGMPFSPEELSAYLRENSAPVSPADIHSPEYKAAYSPSYRLVRREYARYLPVFRDISALAEKGRAIVSIDGRCASGKTALAALLREVFDCAVIPMDDFFLPGGMRTAARLSFAGGNIHHERFAAEVIPGLVSGKDFEYRAFDCRTMDYVPEPVFVPATNITVVEGAYSRHPDFPKIYDYNIFMTCPPEIQKQRLLERNGEKMILRFLNEWIPMEEAYFTKYDIMGDSDTVIDTGAERG